MNLVLCLGRKERVSLTNDMLVKRTEEKKKENVFLKKR